MTNKSIPTKTDELISSLLKEKYAMLSYLEKEETKRESTFSQKDAEIAYRDKEIRKLQDRIVFMQSSKFWTLRNKYFDLGLYKLRIGKFLEWIFGGMRGEKGEKQSAAAAQPSWERFHPKVTIIVPNYNHAKYLRQRLDSIYSQTYENYEVILLDDKSSDESKKILREYGNKFKRNTKCIFNERNSGSVFMQWHRGIKLAKGDLIWIAESDDYCDKDFLAKLVTPFVDRSVMLAYAYPQFVNENGDKFEFAFDNYVAELSSTKWTSSYIETAHNEVKTALGIKNTIPNVSGVVFRNAKNLQIIDEIKQFKVCGDWHFYTSLIRGGKLAFVRETTSYYRYHTANTSTNFQKDPGFIKEYETVAKHIARNYKIPQSTLRRNMLAVKSVWEAQNPGKEKLFAQNYNISAVIGELAKRKPNILMGVYAFTTGGGETVPVRLANSLKRRGFGVTIFNYLPLSGERETIRAMLDAGIPVVDNADFHNPDQILEDYGIELIHSHHTSVDVFFSKRKRRNIPHVVSTHGLYDMLPYDVFMRVGNMVKHVSYWVYTAEKNLKALQRYEWFSQRPIKKLMNAVGPPTFSKKKITRENLTLKEDDFVLCLVSRAIMTKGWCEAVDAVRIANTITNRHIVLLLVGDGPLYEEFKEIEHDNKDVRLLGFRENLSDYFSISDIGILPTTFPGESFPLVLLECLMVHRPFISTDMGEIKSMLTLDNGALAGEVLELDGGKINVMDMANTIVKLAENQELYSKYSENAAIVSARYSMDRIVTQYEEVYTESLMKNKREASR